MGYNALTIVVCPTVHLSVRLFVPESRTEGHRKLKIGRKDAHDTGDQWPHLDFGRSPGRLTTWPKISHIFRTGLHTWYMDVHVDMRGDLRAESSGSLFKGQDIVAASTTVGRTACRQCSGQDCNRTESAAVSFHQRCGCLSDKRIFFMAAYIWYSTALRYLGCLEEKIQFNKIWSFSMQQFDSFTSAMCRSWCILTNSALICYQIDVISQKVNE